MDAKADAKMRQTLVKLTAVALFGALSVHARGEDRDWNLGFTSLQHAIGRVHPVSIAININGRIEQIAQDIRIGDPADNCPGRCGPGCGSVFERQVYTLECLEHDLCDRTYGTWFGPCADLMKRAAYGFAFGGGTSEGRGRPSGGYEDSYGGDYGGGSYDYEDNYSDSDYYGGGYYGGHNGAYADNSYAGYGNAYDSGYQSSSEHVIGRIRDAVGNIVDDIFD